MREPLELPQPHRGHVQQDVVFAVAARSFFARVLDGLVAALDVQTAATFPPELLRVMVVGRPVAQG